MRDRLSRMIWVWLGCVIGSGLVPIGQAEASWGAVSCFVTIGSQQQVPQHGLLTANFIYGYTPMTLPSGSNGIIAEADQENRRIIPNHHRELGTITNSYTLDVNYGITDRLGVQVTLPWMNRHHEHCHRHGGGGAKLHQWVGQGIGDLRVTTKYSDWVWSFPREARTRATTWGKSSSPPGNWGAETSVSFRPCIRPMS